mgnify:CR=1 FL=1
MRQSITITLREEVPTTNSKNVSEIRKSYSDISDQVLKKNIYPFHIKHKKLAKR